LTPKLLALALEANRVNINMTVDAEEADRMALSLEIFEGVFRDRSVGSWEGFGLAVQAYQKRGVAGSSSGSWAWAEMWGGASRYG